MIPAWIHPPIAHQRAFKSKFNAPPVVGAAPSVGNPTIREKVQPRMVHSQVHSQVFGAQNKVSQPTNPFNALSKIGM